MRATYLLWATGQDRPGIVAAVSNVLYRQGCNLEDSAMTRLGGEFGILLIFSAPRKKDAASLEVAFAPIKRRFALNLGIKPLSTRQARFKKSGDLFVVTLHGVDRPGLVYRITDLLAKHQFNITDLTTHRTVGGGKKAGYILVIEGEIRSRAQVARIRRALSRTARRLRATVSLSAVNDALIG